LTAYTADAEREQRGKHEMAIQLQQFGAEGQMNPANDRNIMLLTVLSKLMMALVMGAVTTVILLVL
jgi:uncharacterized membrane protein